ncbi:MAG: hypothetical protein MHM6MM_007273 [Cercozoa sp. M6MM]
MQQEPLRAPAAPQGRAVRRDLPVQREVSLADDEKSRRTKRFLLALAAILAAAVYAWILDDKVCAQLDDEYGSLIRPLSVRIYCVTLCCLGASTTLVLLFILVTRSLRHNTATLLYTLSTLLFATTFCLSLAVLIGGTTKLEQEADAALLLSWADDTAPGAFPWRRQHVEHFQRRMKCCGWASDASLGLRRIGEECGEINPFGFDCRARIVQHLAHARNPLLWIAVIGGIGTTVSFIAMLKLLQIK